jgi:hypothetical protein
MLKAGALFVSVTISFVIAVLISLLIVLAFQYKIQYKENLLQKKLARNVNSALTLLMASEQGEEQSLMDLYEEGTDSVEIKKSSWGVYEVASVRAFSGRFSLTRTVEYGYRPDETISGAIYLTDLSRPLNVCGKTKITGTCYLPESGVKRGYIEGKSFEGSSLINGVTKNSKNSLPVLNKEIIKKLSGYFTNASLTVFKEIDHIEKDSLVNSFHDTTIFVRLAANTSIDGKYIAGNIIIYSPKMIEIGGGSVLEDVLIFASSIKIKNNFKGNFQAFATDSIIVEENCKLNYPSALGLFKQDHKTKQPFILLKKDTEFKGVIFTSQSEYVSDLAQTLISIDKQTLVHGQLYADGFADIKGEVRGMVCCNKFLLRTPSSLYENHLLDAIIDYSKLSVHYVGSGLLASGKRKKIIKWLE